MGLWDLRAKGPHSWQSCREAEMKWLLGESTEIRVRRVSEKTPEPQHDTEVKGGDSTMKEFLQMGMGDILAVTGRERLLWTK